MPTEKWTDEELEMLTDEERAGLLEDDGASDDDGADDDTDEGGDGAEDAGGEDGKDGDGDEKPEPGKDDDGKKDKEPADGDGDKADDTGGEEEKPGEKSGEEDETDAGADDGDGKDDEDGGADTEVDEPAAFQPKAPAGAKDRLEEIEAELDALDEKMDDGELTAKEFRQAERKLRGEQQDLRDAMLKDTIEYDQAVKHWRQETIPTFLAEHPQYEPGTVLYNMLDTKLRALQQKALESGGSDMSPSLLKKAHNALTAELQAAGLTTKAGQKQTQQKPGKKRDLPPSLAEVPAADPTDTDDGGEFSHLDRLEGEEYEDALAKLTETQQERYFASR